jgi:vitamin-K-epoxide reductase (warfarin-sensitive)
MKIILLACLGLAVSAYAYFLEQKLKRSEIGGASAAYKPACDINDRFSCSKPIMSEYGSLFGISNAVLGLLFYVGIILLTLLGFMKLVFWGALAACAASLILAYILFFKLKVFCVVCTSIYLINFLLLWASHRSF